MLVVAALSGVVIACASATAGDRADPQVVARIATGRGSRPCAEVAGFGRVWITTFGTGYVLRIDPRTNRVTGRVRVGARPCGLAVGAGSVWVNGYGSNSVERIDPRRLRRTRSITVDP